MTVIIGPIWSPFGVTLKIIFKSSEDLGYESLSRPLEISKEEGRKPEGGWYHQDKSLEFQQSTSSQNETF